MCIKIESNVHGIKYYIEFDIEFNIESNQTKTERDFLDILSTIKSINLSVTSIIILFAYLYGQPD